MPPAHTLGQKPRHDANRLGLDYRAEINTLGAFPGPIVDIHTHIGSVASARTFFQVANLFGIQKVWSMSRLEIIDDLKAEFGDRIEFIAVPNYQAKDDPNTFTTDWLRRIEQFAAKGVRLCKFWAAPRGIDFHPALQLDAPIRRQAMDLAQSLGMSFMTHVGDPDTWFATHYQDADKYGTKAQHLETLERLLDEYPHVTWIGAHMSGTPEDLDVLQGILDRHPNYHIDTSATKWMVRELSKHPPATVQAFFQRNRGRILFGSDIVTDDDNIDFDLYASRYWALRTLFETNYDGPSPIVDPDLRLVDPEADEKATAHLRGAQLDRETLTWTYAKAFEEMNL